MSEASTGRWGIVRVGVAGLAATLLGGCATHYVEHTGTAGSAYVSYGNDLLHCNVVEGTPHCWTSIGSSLASRGRP